jgi:hypothetical protein
VTPAAAEGALYVAVGAPWLAEARTSVLSLRALHPDLPVDVLTVDAPAAFDAAFGGIDGVRRVDCLEALRSMGVDPAHGHAASRALKVSVVELSRFERTLFLDSDTVVRGSVGPLFEALRDGPGGADLVVTNEPCAQHETRPDDDRPQAVALDALSNPNTFNSGVFAFSRRLRDTGFGRAWRDIWTAQTRTAGCEDWDRLSDQRAFNAAIQRLAPRRAVFPNTVWNAQCKILGELIAKGAWDAIRIVHCKLAHRHGCDPDALMRQPCIRRFRLRSGGAAAARPSSAPPRVPTRLGRFRDAYRGERCVIVCNGPSLNLMDLRCLRREIVFGLNKIHLGLDRFGFHPRFLVVVNEKVAAQAGDALRALQAIKFVGARAARHLPEDGLTHHLAILDPPVVFSTDIETGVREGGTVTHATLQIAYYMGFREVVIVGMDHRFTFDGAPHETRRMAGPDPNHFSPDYFQGQDWDNPDLARSEASYAEARRVFEADGRIILDATVDGACTVFEKVDYRAVFDPPRG